MRGVAGVTQRRLLCLVAGACLAIGPLATAAAAVRAMPAPVTARLSATGATAVPAPGVIRHQGNHLLLNGHVFRFAGANEYYLGLDDNLRDSSGAPTYPSHALIDAALDSAVSMGVTVVRAHTLGISVGNPRSIEPSLDHWNSAAFEPIDYAVVAARARGLHLMIPLTDEWRWYHGGKSIFTGWRGYPNNPDPTRNVATDAVQRRSEAHFYTDPVVIGDFEDYIRQLLTHHNPDTGLAYRDDPTIAIWETGNELWDAPPAWTDQIARFIKSLAPNQLVADGSAATGKHVADAAITSPSVDIVGGHFYPRDAAWMTTDAAVAAAHGKVYVVGEYDWTGDLAPWLHTIVSDPDIAGAAFWTLLPRLPNGQPEPHGDGYALWAPGIDAATTAAVEALSTYARQMR